MEFIGGDNLVVLLLLFLVLGSILGKLVPFRNVALDASHIASTMSAVPTNPNRSPWLFADILVIHVMITSWLFGLAGP